jgi:hypothetical protein
LIKRGERGVVVPGARNLRFPELVRVGRVPISIDSGVESDLPDDFVFEAGATRLLGPEGWMVGQADTFLPDASFWMFSATRKRLGQHPIYARKKAPTERFLPGLTLSLASDHVVGSPAHLLADSLTRLPLALAAGRSLEEFDWIYLPRPAGSNIDHFVNRLGVPAARVLNWQQGTDLACERLVGTRFPGLPGNPPPAAIRFWQDRVAGENVPAATGRLYLSQQNARRCLADAEPLEALLANAGFETCFPDTDPHTVERCARARWIVALDGSNLANLIFCPRGAAVLVLCPTFFPNPPYTYTLASHCGHRLIACGVQPVEGGPKTTVDLDDFERALDRLLDS